MIGLIRSRGRSVVRSRLVVSGSGLMVSGGRLMVSRGGFGGVVRSGFGGMIRSRVLGSVVRSGVFVAVVLLDGVIFADLALVFDVGVILLVLVNVIVDDLSAAVGQLNAILAY